MGYMRDATGKRLDSFEVPQQSRIAKPPTTAAALGTWDPIRHLYNYKPAQLSKTRARMAAAMAGTGKAKLALIGDSITNGNQVTKLTQSYPARVRAGLTAAGYPSGGTGYTVPAFDQRWSFGSGWSLQNAVRFTYQCVTNGSTATYTSDVAGTTATVYYRNTGAFSVAIDGGAAVNVAASSSNTLKAYTVTGLADTTHTIVITTQSAFTYIMGAEVSRATGLCISNFGLSGTTTTDWIATGYDAAFPTVTQWAPDFISIKLGTNDQRGGSIAAATYKAQLTTLATNALALADVLLIAPIPSDSGNGPQDPYNAAAYEVADALDLPLVDMRARFISYATANTYGMMSEGTHPNAAGYQDIATGLLNLLGR